MSNYVKATNFTAKDSLPTGNSGKIVKGAELDTEFTAIASAISSKADINSPTFTGTPAAPTASLGTNTTQVATTAFVQAALQAAYPVGSIYINATNSNNPGTLLGFGTWSAFGAGRMPVGFDASNSLFDTAEETGGSADAIVVAHTHSLSVSGTTSGQSAGHTHTFSGTSSGQSATHSHAVNDSGHSHSWSFLPMVGTSAGSGSYAEGSGGSQGTSTATTGITLGNASADHTHTYSGTTSAVSGDHTHTVTSTGTSGSTGSSATNANIPPYITVYMWKRTG